MSLLIAELPLVLARRGSGRLLEGLYNGDPMAWTIAIGVGALVIGVPLAKHFMGNKE